MDAATSKGPLCREHSARLWRRGPGARGRAFDPRNERRGGGEAAETFSFLTDAPWGIGVTGPHWRRRGAEWTTA